MAKAERWIKDKAAATLQPAQVETALDQILKNWPESAPPLVELIEQFPLGESALLHLLAISSICATRLQRNPEILLWLAEPEVSLARRGFAQMSNDLHIFTADSVAADDFRLLRLWKGREMVRVALREIANVASLEETTAELSHIAEICIRRVLAHWDAELRTRHGAPSTELTVLGLGKLGGSELNHSSDVDLIFLYGEEGQLSSHLSYHEFFNRLSKKIMETFLMSHPEGALFRIDLRLRPEGSAGPLARSLESMEHYYWGFGETWERLALIKARGVAGNRELAYEFLQQHQPFIYPKSPTPDLLDEIANIKRRIERDVVGQEKLERNVKLGRGGIREIEFVVQTLQFIHGARHAFLQETSTLKALQGIAQLELISRQEVLDLDRAYRFLRRTEHRLQIEAEQQTHTIPASPEDLQRLAKSLGFDSAKKFTSALEQEMRAVRKVFKRVIADAPATRKPDTIDLSLFSDSAQAERAINGLAQGPRSAHVSPRTRQVFRKLRPLLLAQLARTADPDSTLTQLVRFVEAYGLRNMLFELLVTNPKLLELLINTFDASRFAADLLVRHPQLLEDSTRDGRLDGVMDQASHLQQLRSLPKKDEALDYVRTYRQAQLLRILLRDVVGLNDFTTLCREQGALAEACLIYLNEIVKGENLTIIAMGKFGGGEITYGADLDVLFIGDDLRAAHKILGIVAQPSAEGKLSRVDARLRPEGEKGPLVSSLESYQRYYAARAQTWELQALTRARCVVGPVQNEFIEMAKNAWRQAGQQPSLFQNIDSMLNRIRRERGSGPGVIDFKASSGGIIEGEFLVQALQMRANLWEPNWNRAVEALRKNNQLSESETKKLKTAYDFLRRCESVLRRYENASVSSLPPDVGELKRFSRRMKFDSAELFTAKYESARTAIHEIYLSRVGSSATDEPAASPTLAEQKS
jgi:[glutamine synthetase] adenylyltransferase / [glutamine synthetase]-adenylyl-L-tyrosine phosphorylase